MISFLDTFALLAWVDTQEPQHTRVAKWFENSVDSIVTTEWILLEFANSMSSPKRKAAAIRLLDIVRSDERFQILGYEQRLSDAGDKLYRARPDKAWSLTDCISFVVMTERKITEALTADHHFRQAGFIPVFLSDTQP